MHFEKTLLKPFLIRPYRKSDDGHSEKGIIYSDKTKENLEYYNKTPLWSPVLVTCPMGNVPGVERAWAIKHIMNRFPYCDVIFIVRKGAYLLPLVPYIVKDMKNKGLFKQKGLFDKINALELIIWRIKGSESCLLAEASADNGFSFKRLREYLSNQECVHVPFQDLEKEEPVKSLNTTPEIPFPLHQHAFPNDGIQYALTSFGIAKETLASQNAELVTSRTSLCSRQTIVNGGEWVSSNNVAETLSYRDDTRNVTRGERRIHSQESAKPARYPRYSVERNRLESFFQWPHAQPTPKECAASGFFYTSEGDMVRCFQCGICLKDFTSEDNPMEEHIKNSETCQFLIKLFGVEDLKLKRDQLKTTINPNVTRLRQYAEFQKNRGTLVESRADRNPEYKTLVSRLRSYESFNFRCVKTPEVLAEAGFFYTGVGDHVRCFSCNGGLRNWEDNDDPWTEHCKWFPACSFAKETKGEAFIEHIQQMDNPELTMMNAAASSSATNYPINSDQDLVAIKIACIDEMGFSEEVFEKAVYQLKLDGYNHPEIDDVINRIALIQTEMNQDVAESVTASESIQDENQRLKRMLICCKCTTRNSNALFLPCAHHVMCMECAGDVIRCPVCKRGVSDTVRTYMG